MSLSSQNRLTRFLTELDKNNVRYVSWKNNHQLQAVFAGQGDIDLFVPIEDKPVFVRCCERVVMATETPQFVVLVVDVRGRAGFAMPAPPV